MLLRSINLSFKSRATSCLTIVRWTSNLPAKSSKKQVKPNAALPPIPNLPESSKPTDSKPYIPKLKYPRTSYEFPGLPQQKRTSNTAKPWKKHLPLLFGTIAVGYTLYALSYFLTDSEENPQELLLADKFVKFVVTNKQVVDNDHFIMEVTPRYGDWAEKLTGKKSLWDGSRIWSVDIKQPEIMVTRRYTPLPLQIVNTLTDEKLIRITDESNDCGKLCFYIKKYDSGEVARWLSKKRIGDEVEIRGPFIEYEFPFHPLDKAHTRPQLKDLPSRVPVESVPTKSMGWSGKLPLYDNLNFYAGGTGIAPILQVLLSRNPYKGFVNLHYSCRTETEIPFKRYLYFLEKLDRAKVHYYINETGQHITTKNIAEPAPKHYVGYNMTVKEKVDREQLLKAKMEEIKKEKEQGVFKESFTVLPEIAKAETVPTEVDQKAEDETTEQRQKYATALQQAAYSRSSPKENASLSIVCGPEGYVSFIAGDKDNFEQGEVKGLLGIKKWTNQNVFKL